MKNVFICQNLERNEVLIPAKAELCAKALGEMDGLDIPISLELRKAGLEVHLFLLC
jgi:hypothetical protein